MPDPVPPDRANAAFAPVGAVAVAWSSVAVASFFELWLFGRLWVFAWLVLAGAWTVAVVVSLGAVARLLRRRAWPAATTAALLATGLAVVIALTDWTRVYAHTWFALHRDGFARVAALADGGGLGSPADWPYYGAQLPPGLRSLSISGQVAGVGVVGGRTVLLLPAYVGIPDGAVGFARIPPGTPEVIDGFGDPVAPVVALGDDWYWVA